MDATDNELLETQYYGCCVVDLYMRSRTHLGLDKDAPTPRPVMPAAIGRIFAVPEVHGLHHRYDRAAA
jgi:hypothetical protein